jgi:hypothetical protein
VPRGEPGGANTLDKGVDLSVRLRPDFLRQLVIGSKLVFIVWLIGTRFGYVPKAGALPGCATPRCDCKVKTCLNHARWKKEQQVAHR